MRHTHSDGDIGDYFKYGLLRVLAYSGLKLGIHSYCTLNDSKIENAYGRYFRYLGNPGKYKACDPELFETLKVLTGQKERHEKLIEGIAQSPLFPLSTVFYTDPLSFQDMPVEHREQHRQGWFAYGLNQLQDCDLVFLDPTHGLEVKSINPYGNIKGPYYTAMVELKPFLNREQSLMIHQHIARKSVADVIIASIEEIRNATGYTQPIQYLHLGECGVMSLVFILLMQRHQAKIEESLKVCKASYFATAGAAVRQKGMDHLM